MKKKAITKDAELRMDEAEFDRMMNKALGVAPPPPEKKSREKNSKRKQRR